MPPAGFKRSRALWDESRRPGASWKDVISAILYEFQPIRFHKAKRNQVELAHAGYSAAVAIFDVLKCIPGMAKGTIQLLWCMNARHWIALVILVGYCCFVRFMHEILLAGPLIITVTCLSLIFTIGLGDNQDRDGLSAYAVFNRGFDRLLGSVDVDALVAQHVGGGMAPGLGGVGRLPPHDDDDGDQHHRAQGRHQEQRNNNNDENGDRPNVRNRARKSGKKERRRDLAQRREINDQRQAVAGLAPGALQQLLEDQIQQ